MISEWKVTTLGDISSNITYGYTASAKLDNVGPKFLRITDIVPDRINWDTVPHCIADPATLEKYRLNVGDIVIARTGATTGFNKTIKNTPYEAIYASYLIRYKIDEKQADSNFIGYVLQSPNWDAFIKYNAGGSAQPGANAKQLASYEILLPPLPEQRAIAGVLSSLDDKIDLLHRQNQTLEALAQTLFRQWFVEEAEDDWEEGVLGDVIEIFDSKRIPLSKMEREKMKEGKLYPYYGAASIMDYVNDYLFDGEYILLGEDGTVLTDEGYPVLQYATGKFWVNNHTHVIQAKYPYSNYFIWTYLQKKSIRDIVTGAVQPKINQKNLKSIDFPKYPIEKINDFNKQLSPLFEKKITNNSQIHTLEKLRDMLLPKLMSGEVRIRGGIL